MPIHPLPSVEFLAGKVLRWSLPSLSAPSKAGAPLLKRLCLPQGELAQFYDGDEPIRYMAFLELRPGCPRGNHYHKLKEERLYVIRGQISLVVQDILEPKREAIPLRAGDLAIIRTGIAHALLPDTPGQAIEFSPARFNLADTYRFLLG